MNQLLYTDTHLPGCKQLQMQSILYGIPMLDGAKTAVYADFKQHGYCTDSSKGKKFDTLHHDMLNSLYKGLFG